MIMMGWMVMTVKMPRMVMIGSRRMMSYRRRTGIMMRGSTSLRLHTEQDEEEGYNVVLVGDDADDDVVDDDDDYH